MAALKLSNFYNCDCIFHLSSRFNPRSKGDRAPPLPPSFPPIPPMLHR